MYEIITNNHLKEQFRNLETDEDDDTLFYELWYSTLLIPVIMDGEKALFPEISFDDEIYIPLFTDFDEFSKFQSCEDYDVAMNFFPTYLSMLENDINAFIIDVDGERVPLTREMIGFFDSAKILDYTPRKMTMDEVRDIKNSIDNSELREFLSDRDNWWDFENLMEILLRSDLLTLLASDDDYSHMDVDGVIDLNETYEIPLCRTRANDEYYALLFSSEDENRMYPGKGVFNYFQLVNLPELIRQVLVQDMAGIILNLHSEHIMISREFLLRFFYDFDRPDERKLDDYAFIVERNKETGIS